MIVCTTWKARPLTPEQSNRMMEVWAKTEASMAESGGERLCWYIAVDGSSGVTISKVDDVEAATAASLEAALALGEFLDLESKIVVDLDAAMGPITRAMELING